MSRTIYPFLAVFRGDGVQNEIIGQKWVNPFQTNVPFLYPLKTFGFLTFSGGLEIGHWREKS